MSCTSYTLSGLNIGCKNSVGGIQKVWLAPFDNVAWTITSNTAKTPATASFKVYKVRKASSSMTSTFNFSENSGSYFTTEVSMNFLGMDNSKRSEIMAMSQGRTTGAVKDANGKYWAIGVDRPLESSAGTGETGTAMTDANQYTITLSADSKELPYEITDATMIAAIEAITVASA